MKFKANLMTDEQMTRALKRIAHEILENNQGCQRLVLFGIKRRGLPLARELAANIEKIEGVKVPVGALDITYYRDDLTSVNSSPVVGDTDINVDIEDKTVILVDDVFFTGRTARAALEATLAIGRAAKTQLAVLVDRGHRELPIRADYVGKNVPTSREEMIHVLVDEYDGKRGVDLYSV